MDLLDQAESCRSLIETCNNPTHARGEAMIPTLIIEKAAPGEYSVTVVDGDAEQSDFHAGSIMSAIRDATILMPKTQTFHVWYEHVSIGTIPALHMRHDAETLANKLKLLHGQFRG
ncbi:hypothetical protein [Diaphorobacter sp. HDW4B]|uniref:hypothetical protein n=1 Tax=Diaphorobacter sp. HDW4B TaxID=2714925 RepID=UPI001F10ED6F|nr:hypothetical protein [Diaphorobacter sp. HDW4B]